MANLELNQTIRTVLPAAGGLFGVNDANDPAPAPYGPLAIARAAAKPYSTVTLTSQAYTTVTGDLGKVLEVTTGDSDATITMLSASTAGSGAEQIIRKADIGKGMIIVLDGASTLCWLTTVNDTLHIKSTGSAWEIIGQTANSPLSAPSYISTNWYAAYEGSTAAAAWSAKDRIYLTPFEIRETVSIQSIGIRITNGVAGGAVKSGIWRSGPSGTGAAGKPYGAPLIADPTGVAATSGTVDAVYSPASAVTLFAGVYWFGTKCDATSTCPSSIILTPVTGAKVQQWLGASTLSAAMQGVARAYQFDQTYSLALPTFAATDTFTLNGSGVNHPVGAFRVA